MPDDDPQVKIENYERTFEQDDELGLTHLMTENYGETDKAEEEVAKEPVKEKTKNAAPGDEDATQRLQDLISSSTQAVSTLGAWRVPRRPATPRLARARGEGL